MRVKYQMNIDNAVGYIRSYKRVIVDDILSLDLDVRLLLYKAVMTFSTRIPAWLFNQKDFLGLVLRQKLFCF